MAGRLAEWGVDALLGDDPALLKGVESGAKLGLTEAVKIGGQHGYRFSLEEAKAFVQARARAAGRELDEAQLDKVAGGGKIVFRFADRIGIGAWRTIVIGLLGLAQ